METRLEQQVVVVCLKPGEEILASLLEAAAAHGITGGYLVGHGTVVEADLGWWDPEKDEFRVRTFEEPLQVGSLTGGFLVEDGESSVSVSATVAGPELIAFTGRLLRGVVGTSCEIHVQIVPSA